MMAKKTLIIGGASGIGFAVAERWLNGREPDSCRT
jgi:NAD(P)-dependent dehydrogenase (short-subunit alcohol dehydrogenase family)